MRKRDIIKGEQPKKFARLTPITLAFCTSAGGGCNWLHGHRYQRVGAYCANKAGVRLDDHTGATEASCWMTLILSATAVWRFGWNMTSRLRRLQKSLLDQFFFRQPDKYFA